MGTQDPDGEIWSENWIGWKLACYAAFIGAYSYAAPDPNEHWGFVLLSFFCAALVTQYAYGREARRPDDFDPPHYVVMVLILIPWGFGLYNWENLNVFRAGTWAGLIVIFALLVSFILRLIIKSPPAAKKPAAKGEWRPKLRDAILVGPLAGLLFGGIFFADVLFAVYVAELFGVPLVFEPPAILFVAAAVIGLGWALKKFWNGL